MPHHKLFFVNWEKLRTFLRIDRYCMSKLSRKKFPQVRDGQFARH